MNFFPPAFGYYGVICSTAVVSQYRWSRLGWRSLKRIELACFQSDRASLKRQFQPAAGLNICTSWKQCFAPPHQQVWATTLATMHNGHIHSRDSVRHVWSLHYFPNRVASFYLIRGWGLRAYSITSGSPSSRSVGVFMHMFSFPDIFDARRY